MPLQIAKLYFLNALSTMKAELSLLEFKMGKNSPEYLYMRKSIMDFVYKGLDKLFLQMLEAKMLKRCKYHTSFRKGFKKCECGGSSYVNIDTKQK